MTDKRRIKKLIDKLNRQTLIILRLFEIVDEAAKLKEKLSREVMK